MSEIAAPAWQATTYKGPWVSFPAGDWSLSRLLLKDQSAVAAKIIATLHDSETTVNLNLLRFAFRPGGGNKIGQIVCLGISRADWAKIAPTTHYPANDELVPAPGWYAFRVSLSLRVPSEADFLKAAKLARARYGHFDRDAASADLLRPKIEDALRKHVPADVMNTKGSGSGDVRQSFNGTAFVALPKLIRLNVWQMVAGRVGLRLRGAAAADIREGGNAKTLRYAGQINAEYGALVDDDTSELEAIGRAAAAFVLSEGEHLRESSRARDTFLDWIERACKGKLTQHAIDSEGPFSTDARRDLYHFQLVNQQRRRDPDTSIGHDGLVPFLTPDVFIRAFGAIEKLGPQQIERLLRLAPALETQIHALNLRNGWAPWESL